MPETDIRSAVASSNNSFTDFSVNRVSTDGAFEQPETIWTFPNWTQYLGYYKDIPELRAVIDAKATWTVGKGLIADDETTLLLDTIKGWGKDTFNTILENMIRTMQIGGDAFAEIIRDDEDNLINLKPLDTGTMVIVVGEAGLIKRYEQNSKVKGQPPKKFKKENIFHLSRNRVADEIHGQSMIKALAKTIDRINEAKSDWKRVLHHNIDPMIVFKLDTDDVKVIAAFKRKVDAARGKGENMYLPKDTVEFEIISLAPNANLSPLSWIEGETDRFYEASNVPKIIVGGVGGLTEAAVKIAYLAFQQVIEEDQLFIEEEILSQLNIEIDLEFPASLENELISDNEKDGAENIDESETSVNTKQEGENEDSR